MQADPVPGTPRCVLGESPRWDAATGRLSWVDIPTGEVHSLDPTAGQVVTTRLAPLVSALVRYADGWLVGVELGVECRDLGLRRHDGLDLLEAGARTRMNDAALDPAGRLLIGSLATDGRPGAGQLFSIAPDGRVTVLLEGLDISNGLCWSPDGSVLHHVDSGARTVTSWDYDTTSGRLGTSHVLYRHPVGDGVPDGICLDTDGGLWVALWDGARVVRLDATGQVTDEVSLGAVRPSGICFGGSGMETLYIATAVDDLPDPGPDDGLLHAVRTGRVGPQNAVSTTPVTWSSSSRRKTAR